MNRNRILCIILFLSVMLSTAWAGILPQENIKFKVSGTVVNKSDNSPILIAKIQVRDSLDNMVERTMSVNEGIFNLLVAPGNYSIIFNHTGHKTLVKKLVVTNKDIDMGQVAMQEGEEIQAAGITSRTLLRRRGERISYDVSHDPERSKINMMAMMEKIPQLKMSSKHGNLAYENMEIGKILINNAEHGLINKNRQYPMEFIKAGYMKEIEIILPGDPEFRNEKPILRITLSQDLPYGIAGNIEASATTKNSYTPGIDLVTNLPVICVGLGYKYSYAGAPSLQNSYEREMMDGTLYTGMNTNQSISNNHIVSLTAHKTAKSKVNFLSRITGTFTDATSQAESYGNGELLKRTTGNTHSPMNINGRLMMSGKFGKSDPKQGILPKMWNISYSLKTDCKVSEKLYEHSSGEQMLQAVSNNRFEQFIQGRLSLPGKRSMHDKKSHTSSINGGWIHRTYADTSIYGSKKDFLNYRQDVLFVDYSFLGFIGKFSYNFGANAEELINRGHLSSLDNNAFSFIPHAGLSWNPNTMNSFSLSWNRSVSRPNATQLSPITDYSDAGCIETGNKYLNGSSTDNFQFSYILYPTIEWLKLSAIASYSISNGKIASYLESSGDGSSSVKTMTNIDKGENVKMSLVASIFPSKKFDFRLNADFGLNRNILPSGVVNSYRHVSYAADILWNPDWFTLMARFDLRPSLESVQTKTVKLEPSTSLSISRYFKDQHFGVSASVDDILHTGGMMESWIYDTNFTQHNFTERRGRTFMLKVYWRFGKFNQSGYKEDASDRPYDM